MRVALRAATASLQRNKAGVASLVQHRGCIFDGGAYIAVCPWFCLADRLCRLADSAKGKHLPHMPSMRDADNVAEL